MGLFAQKDEYKVPNVKENVCFPETLILKNSYRYMYMNSEIISEHVL